MKKNDTLNKNHYTLTIGWLYPDLMSTYGDRGNVLTLEKRCLDRGINVKIKPISVETPAKELLSCDLLFMGGAQDVQQEIVAQDLKKEKGKILASMIEDEIPGLYICGAYQFLGKYYKDADGTIIDGLGVFDLHTIHPGNTVKRLTGDIAVRVENITPSFYSSSDPELVEGESRSQFSTSSNDTILVGFENHGGRTYLGDNIKPLAKVVKGYGNNGEDTTEGAIYKNALGSYFHGPLLPKNPNLADFLIKTALEKKYKEAIQLTPLDDTLEQKAKQFIAKRLGVKI